MNGYPILWPVFAGLIVVMTVLDIGVVHRRAREMRVSESLGWTLLWVAMAAGFALAIAALHGKEKALLFTTGYLLEKSLSVDNMFVFLLIFKYFGIARHDQGRILHWGVLGAVVLRFVFIWAGVALLNRLHWMLYVFGVILLLTALRMALQKEEHIDPEANFALRLARRFVPLTPAMAALVVVEFSDIVFALDSIPAVIGVTRDPFIVYTSNVFAIMGLRALYFLLAGLIGGLPYLKHGISAVLAFVGAKMLVEPWVEVPTGVSLGVIAAVLGLSAAASLIARPAAGRGS